MIKETDLDDYDNDLKKLNVDVEKSSNHQMSKDNLINPQEEEDPVLLEKQMSKKSRSGMGQEITLSGEMLYHMKKLEEQDLKSSIPPSPDFKKEQKETILQLDEPIKIEASDLPLTTTVSAFQSKNIYQIPKKDEMPQSTKHLANSKKKAFRGFANGGSNASVSSSREVAANFESIPDELNRKATLTSVDQSNMPFITKSNFYQHAKTMVDEKAHPSAPLSLEDNRDSMKDNIEVTTEDKIEKSQKNKMKAPIDNIIRTVTKKGTMSGKMRKSSVKKFSDAGSAYRELNESKLKAANVMSINQSTVSNIDNNMS